MYENAYTAKSNIIRKETILLKDLKLQLDTDQKSNFVEPSK